MTWYSCDSRDPNLGFNHSELVKQFWGNSGIGSMSNLQTLVSDGVKPKVGVEEKDAILEMKYMAALKSHSEAERRRRERINAHLETLRGLVPCTEKMDKATLLAEVVSQVKQLKNSAAESSKGLLIPMDADEVRVEPLDESAGNGTHFLASLCCDYQPELMSDVKQAFHSLHLHIVKAEVSTLGRRVKNVFVFTSGKNDNGDVEERQILLNSVHRILSSIVEKISLCNEYSPRTMFPNKRPKTSFLESSSLTS